MVTKKDRRHSGYITPRAMISKKDMIKHDLFIDMLYDDWLNYRDSFRDWYRDFKTIKRINQSVLFFNEEMYKKRERMNLKQRRLLIIRNIRRFRKRLKLRT